MVTSKIVALGGEPTTTPGQVASASSNREMLAVVLKAEKKAVEGYIQRAKQTEEFGDKGLMVQSAQKGLIHFCWLHMHHDIRNP